MAETTGFPDAAVIGQMMGDACMVQVMKIDTDGQTLATAWMVPQSYVDVHDQLTALFGAPAGDASLDLGEALPSVHNVLEQPGTHIQFGA